MNNDSMLEREKNCLSKNAAKSSSIFLTQRLIQESEEDCTELRLPFQRDRDRIIHSRAFRRLMHKTQVFNANMGDHYRNRLTHTMEVCQIARSIGKYLALNDELIEGIALGHDLGHTPFGHIGERTLHLIISGKMISQDYDININDFGGFKHNFQGLQMVDNIEKRSNNYKGLNLTLAVREGILKHTGMKMKIPQNYCNRLKIPHDKSDDVIYNTLDLTNINIKLPSFTLEGQVVAIADEIAQCTHDLEDGLRAKIIKINDIIKSEFIQLICEERKIILNENYETVDIRNTLIKYMVGYLINDVCTASEKRINQIKAIPEFKNKEDVYKEKYIVFSHKISEMHEKLSDLITKSVIASQQVTQSDSKSEYIIIKLFKAYYVHPQQLPDHIIMRYFTRRGLEFNRLLIEEKIGDIQKDSEFIRLICDHIASMTDQYAAREYRKLYEPEFF